MVERREEKQTKLAGKRVCVKESRDETRQDVKRRGGRVGTGPRSVEKSGPGDRTTLPDRRASINHGQHAGLPSGSVP